MALAPASSRLPDASRPAPHWTRVCSEIRGIGPLASDQTYFGEIQPEKFTAWRKRRQLVARRKNRGQVGLYGELGQVRRYYLELLHRCVLRDCRPEFFERQNRTTQVWRNVGVSQIVRRDGTNHRLRIARESVLEYRIR